MVTNAATCPLTSYQHFEGSGDRQWSGEGEELRHDAHSFRGKTPHTSYEDDAKQEGEDDVKYEIVSNNDASLAAGVLSGNEGYPTNYIKTSKYTWWNFVFLNLWLQFHKIANIYFLLNMIFALIPGVSPVFPVTTITPLVAVVGVASGRDAWEDYKRHKDDDKANSTPVEVLRPGSPELVVVGSKDVEVGDIVFLRSGDQIPADILLLASSNEYGTCYVETANLDGESNLKQKIPISVTKHLTDRASFQKLRMELRCDMPSEKLTEWEGALEVDSVPHAANLENLVLRGCVLKQTEWVYGMAVYTGVNTKMFHNLTPPPIKASRLDTKLNRLILWILVVQQVVIIVLCSISYQFSTASDHKGAFYLAYFNEEYSPPLYFITHYLTYFVLLSLMMPISLFLSMELCKALQARFMEWDLSMYDATRDLPMKAKTASLNEELSQVQVIFTDKTGTLTENEMRFAKACIGMREFNELVSPGSIKAAADAGKNPEDIHNFLRALAYCNTVVASRDSQGTVHYAGDSTDEVALVEAARQNGVTVLERREDEVTVRFGDDATPTVVPVLCVIPFSSERKMMSVVVRDPVLGLTLFTKGADSSILPNLDSKKPSTGAVHDAVSHSLSAFACDGLRTLCIAYRQLSEDEFSAWFTSHWEKAKVSLKDRQEKLSKAAKYMETRLLLLGATGIEDRLQEGVPSTIDFFRKAGVVIWVLTGDKRETAINIAKSSYLVDPDETDLIILDVEKDGVKTPAEQAASVLRQVNDAVFRIEVQAVNKWSPPASPVGSISFRSKIFRNSFSTASGSPRSLDLPMKGRGSSCVVVDGKTLAVIMENCSAEFTRLANKVTCAICCRVTPLQKAEMVTLFQDLGYTALGVGDGANDVSMIQSAKVGIGIIGLEGSQAERASDYAIPKFRHLVPLLAVHGRYSLLKNSYLIQYSFYKNIVYSVCQVLYSFMSGFTGQTIFDSWVIICFNMVFTLLPPLVMGFLEYDLRPEEVKKYPVLYKQLRSPSGGRMSKHTLLRWLLWSLLHAAVIFSFSIPIMQTDDCGGFRTSGIWTHGSYIMASVILVVLAKASLCFMTWTYVHVACIILSFVFYHGFVVLYSSLPMFMGHSEYYGVGFLIMKDPKYYLLMIIVATLVSAVELAIVFAAKQFCPQLVDLVRESMLLRKEGLRKGRAHDTGRLVRPTPSSTLTSWATGGHDRPAVQEAVPIPATGTMSSATLCSTFDGRKGSGERGGGNSLVSLDGETLSRPLLAFQHHVHGAPSPPSPTIVPRRTHAEMRSTSPWDEYTSPVSSPVAPSSPYRIPQKRQDRFSLGPTFGGPALSVDLSPPPSLIDVSRQQSTGPLFKASVTQRTSGERGAGYGSPSRRSVPRQGVSSPCSQRVDSPTRFSSQVSLLEYLEDELDRTGCKSRDGTGRKDSPKMQMTGTSKLSHPLQVRNGPLSPKSLASPMASPKKAAVAELRQDIL